MKISIEDLRQEFHSMIRVKHPDLIEHTHCVDITDTRAGMVNLKTLDEYRTLWEEYQQATKEEGFKIVKDYGEND